MLLPRTPLDMLLGSTHRRNTGGTIGATADDVYVAYTDSGYYLCDRICERRSCDQYLDVAPPPASLAEAAIRQEL